MQMGVQIIPMTWKYIFVPSIHAPALLFESTGELPS